jgi:hypothetical protein
VPSCHERHGRDDVVALNGARLRWLATWRWHQFLVFLRVRPGPDGVPWRWATPRQRWAYVGFWSIAPGWGCCSSGWITQ